MRWAQEFIISNLIGNKVIHLLKLNTLIKDGYRKMAQRYRVDKMLVNYGKLSLPKLFELGEDIDCYLYKQFERCFVI